MTDISISGTNRTWKYTHAFIYGPSLFDQQMALKQQDIGVGKNEPCSLDPFPQKMHKISSEMAHRPK